MAAQNTFTLSQVASHNSKNDLWVVIDGRVLNVSKFLEEHPGGEEVLVELGGKDASKEFYDVGHSKAAEKMVVKYQVGVLRGYSFKDHVEAAAPTKNKKEMKAFVIKEDKGVGFRGVSDLLLPLLVAASYLSYRYITMVY